MSDTLHVVPVNDLVDHDTSPPRTGLPNGCPCDPEVQPVDHAEPGNGPRGQVIVHRAIDGRL